MFQNEKSGKKDKNLSACKKVVEGLWKKNFGKGILCMVKLVKIGLDLRFLKMSFNIKSTGAKLEFTFLSIKGAEFSCDVVYSFFFFRFWK